MGRRRALVVGLLAIVSWGCAGEADGTSPELQSVADAARVASEDEDAAAGSADAAYEQMLDLGNEGFAGDLTDEEEDCFYEHPGLADLDPDAVVSDPDAVKDRVALMQVLLDCIDRPEAFAPLFANAFRSASIDLSDEESTCVMSDVLANASDPARLLVIADSTADVQVLMSAMEECLTEEHYAELMLEEGAGPQAYGEDERLDSMYDDCTDGELRACDLLWLQASAGSAYEEHAATCGGTQEATGAFCSDEAETNGTGYAPPDSPGLEVLANDCEDGDSTACDLLYNLVAPGHELENVGFTCGGRIAVGAIPDCRTRFP